MLIIHCRYIKPSKIYLKARHFLQHRSVHLIMLYSILLDKVSMLQSGDQECMGEKVPIFFSSKEDGKLYWYIN